MPTTAETLLTEIEAYLAEAGVTATKFGVAAVNDGHLVANLRKGHSVTLRTADRVRAYLQQQGAEHARAARRARGEQRGAAGGARRSGALSPLRVSHETLLPETRMPHPSRRVLLIIGGGIAAYKCLGVIRRLRERGIAVRTVMTRAAQEFITPLSVGALTSDRVFTELFDLNDEREIGHIRLSREADLIVVAPATADLLAKMAGGHADDLATAVLMATDKPVLVAPAMNPRMWTHPATRRNVALLESDGVRFIGPGVGEMAERGEAGPGRLVEEPELVAAIEAMLGGAGAETAARARGPLAGRHVLVTSGPTHEPIDPVRYIANRSSGKQGSAIAAEAAALGARVTLVTGPAQAAMPDGVTIVRVETALQMLDAVRTAMPADIAIFAAAVADWRVATQAGQKIKKTPKGGSPKLELVENPDILKTIGSEPPGKRPPLVIGFAAETQNVIENAKAKRIAKGADWIVANDVSPATGIMGGDRNTVHVVSRDGVESWPELDKGEVAHRLMARAAEQLLKTTAIT